jgi:DNA-binding transcriptional LysR family regulator
LISSWRLVDLVFRQHNASYQVTLEAGGWEVIKTYVELGLGVSIVTDVGLTGEEQLAKISLGEYYPDRSCGIVLRRGEFLSPQAKRLLEIVREVLKHKEK